MKIFYYAENAKSIKKVALCSHLPFYPLLMVS
jgi:hypothetical protein